MKLFENKKVKRIVIGGVSLLLCGVLVLGVLIANSEKTGRIISITNSDTPLSFGIGKRVEVKQTDADINVIPDKYNTGCKGELTRVEGACTINGITVKYSGGIFVLDFFYSNKSLSGDIVFDNIDFSLGGFSVNNEGKVTDRDINVIFNNCRFLSFKNAVNCPDNYSYTFNNCTLCQFQGSNAIISDCQFGHSYRDCLNPFKNVSVSNCFFYDLASKDPEGAGKHSDGTQIYANKDVVASNINITNCRYEVPAVQTTGNSASVNACIAVGLEYNDATNIHINNCYVNGGGYTLYATKKYDSITLTDVLFENVAVGNAKLFGTLYPKVVDGVSLSNVHDQDSLYVSSVWQDEEGTHIITTNDTGIDRKLKILTNEGIDEFVISKCLGGNELRYDNYDMSYEMFPFDLDITIPNKVNYVVCYDATYEEEKQIRFVSFDGTAVYLNDSQDEVENEQDNVGVQTIMSEELITVETVVSEEEYIEISEVEETETLVHNTNGQCGEGMTFSLDSDGNLYISGTGAMYDYNSAKPAPWFDEADNIVSVIFDEGITTIGSQAFRKLTNIEQVSLPTSIVSVGSNAFIGCKSLSSLNIPAGINNIGRYAFSGTSLTNVSYGGTESDWCMVAIGDHNEPLTDCNIMMAEITNTDQEETSNVILAGECGDAVNFELSADGTLHIYGNGAMKNFDSSKPAPWYDYKDSIISVLIDEGVTAIGSQSFRNAKSMTVVSIPESMVDIGSNSFIGCKSLSIVSLGKNISSIGRFAFSGTGITEIKYAGSEDMWNGILIGDHNEVLDQKNISFQE